MLSILLAIALAQSEPSADIEQRLVDIEETVDARAIELEALLDGAERLLELLEEMPPTPPPPEETTEPEPTGEAPKDTGTVKDEA